MVLRVKYEFIHTDATILTAGDKLEKCTSWKENFALDASLSFLNYMSSNSLIHDTQLYFAISTSDLPLIECHLCSSSKEHVL